MTKAIVVRVEGDYVITAQGADLLSAIAGQASDAKDEAVAAAAVALAAAGVGEYPDTGAGLSGTTEGETFWVDLGDGTGQVYRHDPGPTATPLQKFIIDPTDSGAADIFAGGVPTTAALASSAGAAMVGFQQAGSPVVRRISDKAAERITVDDYKTVLDADDLAAFERCRDYLISVGGGTMRCIGRLYQIGGTFELASGSYTIPLTLECDTGTIIEGTGTADVIKVGGAMYLRGGGIKGNPIIRNTVAGGHLIAFGAKGCTECVFDVTLSQLNPGKSLIYAPSGEIYKSDFGTARNRWATDVAHTVPPVYVRAQGATVNGNHWSPGRCYNAVSTQFFDIANQNSSTWLTNNELADIQFENCPGGAFKVANARGWAFRNLEMWDVGGVYTGHIGWMAGNAGYASVGNRFERVTRHGDSLDTGVCDLFLEACTYSTIDNCFNENATGPRYDLNNQAGIVTLGLLYGIVNRGSSTSWGGLANGANTLIGDTALTVGGLSNPEGFRLTVSGGYVNHDASANSTGHIITSRDGSGTLTKLVFGSGGTSFYPLTDNKTNLGGASGRWKEAFVANGTINTSDERGKQWRGAMTPAEMTAARRIFSELGFYQWTDSIAGKGADAARLHFGVRAQRVWAIMAEEGLVDPIGEDGRPGATPYAFLCFDEWEAEAIPAMELVGEELREAGDRYGVRPDQLALFLIAALEARIAALEAVA